MTKGLRVAEVGNLFTEELTSGKYVYDWFSAIMSYGKNPLFEIYFYKERGKNENSAYLKIYHTGDGQKVAVDVGLLRNGRNRSVYSARDWDVPGDVESFAAYIVDWMERCDL